MEISRDVIFDKNATWRWKENQVTTPNIMEEEKSEASINQHPPSSTYHEASSSHTHSPPRKVPSLQDSYDSCDMAFEPQIFEESVKDEDWIKAIDEEITMIEKNKT